MDRQQWLEWRLDGLGASDAPIVMGVSPWTTRYQLWKTKVNRIIEAHDNPAMQRGREMEEYARCAFEEKFDVSVFPCNIVHPNHKWIRASLDGIDIARRIAVEIKCPGEKDHQMALEGKIPKKYYPQLQHQMMVANLPSINYWSYYKDEGANVVVDFDVAYASNMFDEEEKFWDLVQKKLPPELTDKDKEYVLVESDQWRKAAHEWRHVSEKLKMLEKREQELKLYLLGMAQNQNCEGGGIRLTRSTCQGRIDYEKVLQDLNPDLDLNQYRKEPIEKWSIRNI